MPSAGENRKIRLAVAFYVLLLVCHVALVWLLPYFPTQDGPSHMYNLVILHDILHDQGNWDNFYSVDVYPTPNMGFTFVAYPLLSVLSPGAVERVFITLYVLLLGISVPVLLRAFGRPALPLSFLVFIVIFNKNFLMGFYSNLLGVPLAILAIALAWKIRKRLLAVRLISLNLAGAILLLVHLVPFVIYLLAIGLMGAVEGKEWKDRARRLTLGSATVIPCLLFAALIFYIGPSVDTSAPAWETSLTQAFFELFIFSGASYSPLQILPGFLALLLFCAAAIEGVKRLLRAPDQSDPAVSGAKLSAALCGLLILVHLAGPDELIGGSLFKIRLPWVIVLLALPLLQSSTKSLSPRLFAGLAFLVAALAFAVNVGLLWQQSNRVAQFTSGMEAPLPPAAKLVTVRFDGHQRWGPDVILHAPSYYGLRGAIDLANYEAGADYFWVAFQEGISTPEMQAIYDKPQNVDWSRFPQVDYLLCWKAGSADRPRLAEHFTLFWEKPGSPLTIWAKK